MLSYYFARFASWIACLLPRGVTEVAGAALGVVGWFFVPKWRKALAKENIMLCLGVDEREAERIAKASVTRFGPMLMEFLRFSVIKEHIEDYVSIDGAEHVRKAMESGGGKGGILAAAHCGNWELQGGAIAQAGIPIVGVAKKQKAAGFDRFINEQRTLIGMHITYRSDVREMYDMLAEGWFIGLIMDQDVSLHDGIVLDFFQRPTSCAVGAATMARFKNVPIFPCFIHRDGAGMHHVSILPPIHVERTKNRREDIRRTTQEIVKITEDHIRKYPEEWFWLHDRWKSMREEWHQDSSCANGDCSVK
ncbi:MAG: lysophospholipid acyltransferase family protein [Selenomonadaceae bacterium]|nr:lysophospholipid acyltransferase family protein [Selenomonadaceae bacterium]